MPLSPDQFAKRWKGNTNTERAAAQEHFLNLCQMLGKPGPNEADPDGEWYAFEKGAAKQDGGDGWADVWKRAFFAWEYKGKRKNLAAAYQQLLQYRESLENPPCLVVCDLDRFEVRTNFTGTKTTLHSFTLDDLLKEPEEPLRILRAVMDQPDALRPRQTRAQVTEEVATQFASLAEKLRLQGHGAEPVAHFLNRLLFCFFAEDIGVLPRGLITRLFEKVRAPDKVYKQLTQLFAMMSKGGGFFGSDEVEWVNGGLFENADAILLDEDALATLTGAAKMDWSQVEPAILGTLFERGLDPSKRTQLGAHYTDRESILRVVEPVVIVPLRREFDAMRAKVEKLVKAGKTPSASAKGKDNPNRVFREFLDRLRGVRVLDPACGSGNFLYVTLQLLKGLEKEAIIWGAEAMHLTQELPGVGPEVVRGIELNSYAAELARVTVWIGEIQWMVNNGFHYRTNPVLAQLDSIENRDAILDLTNPRDPGRALWPDAEFIVGNPPFLGGKRLRDGLGGEYVDALFKAWDGQVPREADLVCYWHEMAREMIERKKSKRAGLLATQNIRSGANRKVLDAAKRSGDIFLAWSDEPWIVDGADVRISIVGQDDGSETQRNLDGSSVEVINADLTGGKAGGLDLTLAARLPENLGVAFMGDTKGGAFDLTPEQARALLSAGPNPHGRPNSDVVVPWMNSMDLTRRTRGMFIIDFGVTMSKEDAALYEAPFEYVVANIKDERAKNNRAVYREKWWIHVEPRPALRKATAPMRRFILTPTTAKYRTFAWGCRPLLPDHKLIVIAREDAYAFGVLHSRVHEYWSLRKIARQGVGNDPVYAPTFAFENFAFPWPLNTPDAKLTTAQAAARDTIAAAAKELDDVRSRWLNPPELLKTAPPLAPGLPEQLVAKDETAAKELKKRTLTGLYNARPTWLDLLHRKLDAAVVAAYGWPEDISDEDILAKLLALNAERCGAAQLRKPRA